ncbi:ribose 5-phosphate isomerase A [Agrilactobacillus composti DSM 18527 = JCM 14202]|nr:ribose 5-phosphate isomerase A [Agrilactobacillus composti DSM 18527 = JCM 14202]
MKQDELKKMAAEAAVEFVEDHMIVGLGTGSTVMHMVTALAKRVKAENLTIVASQLLAGLKFKLKIWASP